MGAIFMKWVRGLSNGEAALYSVFLTCAFVIAWWYARQWARKHRKRKQAQLEADARKQAERDADFRRGPSAPGEVDHGVISRTSLNEIGSAIASLLPVLFRLLDALAGDTIQVLHADNDADNRQQILQQLATDLYPDVLFLERVAQTVGPKSVGFVSAYRVLLRPEREVDDEERQTLTELKPVLAGNLVEQFGLVSDVVGRLEKLTESMEGKEENLTRMVLRARHALRAIDQGIVSMVDFCSGELAHAIDSKLKPTK